jgi:hypothetical protein
MTPFMKHFLVFEEKWRIEDEIFSTLEKMPADVFTQCKEYNSD